MSPSSWDSSEEGVGGGQGPHSGQGQPQPQPSLLMGLPQGQELPIVPRGDESLRAHGGLLTHACARPGFGVRVWKHDCSHGAGAGAAAGPSPVTGSEGLPPPPAGAPGGPEQGVGRGERPRPTHGTFRQGASPEARTHAGPELEARRPQCTVPAVTGGQHHQSPTQTGVNSERSLHSMGAGRGLQPGSRALQEASIREGCCGS